MLAEIEDFAHLAAGDFSDAGKFESEEIHFGLDLNHGEAESTEKNRRSSSGILSSSVSSALSVV